MNTQNVILAAKANSGKSTNNVWVVYTSDNSSDKMYCTSAYKAMRLAFLLKNPIKRREKMLAFCLEREDFIKKEVGIEHL